MTWFDSYRPLIVERIFARISLFFLFERDQIDVQIPIAAESQPRRKKFNLYLKLVIGWRPVKPDTAEVIVLLFEPFVLSR